MTQTSLFVKITAKPGRRDEVQAALEAALPAAEAEAGTLVYSFHADKGEPDVTWVFELYTDDDAFAAHSSGEAVAQLFATLGEVLAEPPLLVMAEPTGGKGLPG